MNRDGTARPPARETRFVLHRISAPLAVLALAAGVAYVEGAAPPPNPSRPAWAPIEGPAPAFRIPIAHANSTHHASSQYRTESIPHALAKTSTVSPVRTAGFTTEAALPSLLPLPASRLPHANGRRCIEGDSATLLEPSHRSMPTVLFPAIIYRAPDVVLSIPTRMGEPLVQAVLLTKITGEGAGETIRGNVDGTKVVLHGLTDGVYEIRYLTESGISESDALARPSDRRLLVELAPDLPVVTTSATQPSRAIAREPHREFEVLSLDSFPLPPTISDQIAQGWSLLRKGAHYSALQRLLDALDATSTEPRSDQSRTISDLVESTKLSTLDATAEEIARQLGKRSEWAIALYGLGRIYNAIRLEREPLVSHPLVSAAVCFKAASLLDDTLVGPQNELGVTLFDLDLRNEAKAAFQSAAFADDPVGAYNLGRCHEVDGEILDAKDAYRRALDSDSAFLPAAVEWTRLQLGPDSTALYPDQFGKLVQTLRGIAEIHEEESAEHRWAEDTLTRLSVLEDEIRLNQPSYVVRRLIPKESSTNVSVPEEERQVERLEPEAGANRPSSLRQARVSDAPTPSSKTSASTRTQSKIQPTGAILPFVNQENARRQSKMPVGAHPEKAFAPMAIPIARPSHLMKAGVK